MRRQSKLVNATLKVTERRNAEEKEETSFSDLSKDQKICKGTEAKATMASEKENLSDGNQVRLQKHTLKYSKVLEKELYHSRKDASCPLAGCASDTLNGDVVGEPSWPLNSKEKFSRSGRGSLGAECCLPPKRDKAEEKSCCGIVEKQRRKTVDFATVTTAEFGITQESFISPSIGKSPNALKLRRRSAIGVRGSPENNALIQYLAQQRSNRQKETFTQHASPFKFAKSSKDKIRVFQTPLKSVQEAEGQKNFPGLSQVSGGSQEADCSENKVPFTSKCSLDQQSERSVSDCSGADLKENLKQNLTYGNKSDSKICTTLSSHQGMTVTEPALSKEWAYKEHNPIEYSDAILIRDILEASHELSLEMHDGSKPPVTPVRMGNASLNEHTQSGSQLRSVLKKMPAKELTDCTKEYSTDTVGSGGRESLAVSEVKICEALQTVEKTEQYSSKKPKKKKVTFGEDLSPEIFDKTLPANTPLRKGATPVRHPGSQSSSPFTGSRFTEEPLPQPNFDCDDQCIEPPQELQEDSLAAEDLSPVENTTEVTAVAAESAHCLVKESDKSHTIATRSFTKRKCSAEDLHFNGELSTSHKTCTQYPTCISAGCWNFKSSTTSEGVDLSIPRATSTKSVKDTKNPRKNKLQRPKNITTSAAKKTQRTKHASSGKRRKRKVKKSLYGEREMASKKPLLSPIPEIPEVLSSASSPSSPKANALPDLKSSNDQKDAQWKQAIKGMRGENIPAAHVRPVSEDLDVGETSSPDVTVFQVSDGDLKSVSGPDHKFPSIVPDTNYVSDTYDCPQQAEETECSKEEKESDFLIENKNLQGNFPNKEEWLTGLEFPEQDTGIHEILRRTGRPPKKSRGRRRSSTGYVPPIKKFNFETIGNDLPLSFNVEEVLSAPQLKNNSSEGPFRRKKGSSSETSRVRRSMRLHKDAETEGLAWIPVPNETLKNPPPVASGCKTRRTISTSVLRESENIHHREENLIQFAAPGKENGDPVNLADGPCRRWRRKSVSVSAPQETRTWSQTRKRSITNSVHSKDRKNQRLSEEAEIPVENQANS
ncbi:cell division cycle-associated protein 2 isoform X3 [Oxyura jamaicensis]|uniref:cell division cycle-associated protein 2 isoform X3 n=1 Tax=Oxyura jamaicensis TaxID=8884 RepID=UPI0015A52C3E|nr:cell division cycle-associated protein 2 isoform X3 [Oxyura jamaicensis]